MMELSRKGWRALRAGSEPNLRIVDVVGGTGSGKSHIGNAVTNNIPPPAGKGFKEGDEANSETTQVATLETQVTLDEPTPSGIRSYKLSWSDTQGVSDTEGRTVDFLDHIVEHMRSNPPNGIVVMYNAEQKDTASATLGYKAMKMCFNESLPDGRTLLVMNKMKSLKSLERAHGSKDKALAEFNKIYEESKKNFCERMGLDTSLSNVVPVEYNAFLLPDDNWLKTIHSCIARFPSQPMDCSRFKTFTEVMDYARELQKDAIDAVSAAERCIKDIESRNANIRDDIEWHENRITSMKVAIPAAATAGTAASVALGIFSFGIGAAVAGSATVASVASLTAALVDSQAKLPALMDQLEKNEAEITSIQADKEGNLKSEKLKYEAFMKEVAEVNDVMALVPNK